MSSFGKGKSCHAKFEMPDKVSGLQMTQKNKKEICSKSLFGMLKMGERGVVLNLWDICSWLG